MSAQQDFIEAAQQSRRLVDHEYQQAMNGLVEALLPVMRSGYEWQKRARAANTYAAYSEEKDVLDAFLTRVQDRLKLELQTIHLEDD